jgi:IclR family transcriptional regulator, acetate operon repressor
MYRPSQGDLGVKTRNRSRQDHQETRTKNRTENTTTDRDELFAELEKIREQRHAVDREERFNGLPCTAALITDDDRGIAAISVACPTHRADDMRFFEELREAVLGTANAIELEHSYS